jgi:predicted permease
MRTWWSKIARAFQRRDGLAEELNEEMQAHLEFLIERNVERGMPAEEALLAARRELGNTTLMRERSYESWRFRGFETLLRDIRYGLRGILRAPAFSLIVILTLAVGIGANTAIFSAVYAVLLKPLPYPSGERLVWLGESTAKATGISVTWLNFDHWRRENHSFEAMAGFENADLTLTGRGQAVLTRAGLITSEFFSLTGARPVMGRLFTENDDDPHAPATVVVTQEFWAKALGSDPAILGKTLTLNGSAYTVVGVLARDPDFWGRPMDYYLPLRPTAVQLARRDAHGSMHALALLKPSVTLAVARADINTIMEQLAKADPGPENDHRVYADFLTEVWTGDVRHIFALLIGAVGLVLILACANIGSLLLIRMTQRAREMAIRSAIGAGHARLARQLVTETLLITLLGGVCGLLLADFGLHLMKVFGPRDIPRLMETRLDVPVLVFSAALTLAVGLACSLAPVLGSRRVNLSTLIKESSTGTGSGRLGHTLRGGLVITEIAAALVLLFTSGILLRSLLAAENVNPGFEPDHVLALELQLPNGHYKTDASILDFYARLETALHALPGVQQVGSVNCPPGAGDCGDYWYSILERPAPRREDVPISLFNIVDANYFDTIGIRWIAGRGLTERDNAAGAKVAVINETLARSWWKDARSALGQHIKWGGPYMDGPAMEIVGVVSDVQQMGLDAEPAPMIYSPAGQRVDPAMVVMIRTSGDPAAMAGGVRQVLAATDSGLPVQSLKTMNEWLGGTLARRRFITLLLVLFAGIAVVLAAIGCYGVLNFWVSSRRHEIAIRMAMGADMAAILRRTGTQAAVLGGIGLLIGLGASWGASHWMSSMVFGISAYDPAVFFIAVTGALLIMLVSAAVPLWRATQVSPMDTLREV